MRRGNPDADRLTDRDPDADCLAHADRLPDAASPPDGPADGNRLAEPEPESEPAVSRPACSGAYAGAWHPSRDGLKRWEPTGTGSSAAGCRA